MLNVSPRWLTRKEQARFLHELEKEKSARRRKRNVAIVPCLLQAGCRVAEVVALDVDDVDLRRKTLTVRQGKRGKMRLVPMNRDLTKALAEWMDERNKVEAPDNALFVSERKQRLTVRAIQHFVSQIFDNIGIEDGTCHSLRHSFCKNLLDSGQPITVVAQLAGHEDLESCRRYLLPNERDLRIAVEGISSTR
nr:tyrosine-type recombinase/integrase [Alicyclobacillus sendaiensis]